MIKDISIVILLVCVVILATAVIRLENYHYATFVGMCSEFKADDQLQATKRHDFLHKKETRTNPIWHLLYGVLGE